MIKTIGIFSSIFLIRSLLITASFKYSLIYLFPLEIISLSLLSSPNLLNSTLNWILLGWIGLPTELDDLNDVDDYKWTSILISWICSYILYILYYLCKECNLWTKWSFRSYSLKFVIINYLPLYLWNLNRLFNQENSFYSELISLFIFCLITFVFPSLLFNLIYGDKLTLYRRKFPYLVQYYKAPYKWYLLYQILIKDITGTFITFYYYWSIGNNYSVITILILYFISDYYLHQYHFKILNKGNYYFLALSFLISILSEIELNEGEYLSLKGMKAIITIIYLLSIGIFIYKYRNKTIINNSRLEVIELNHISI